MAQIMKVNQKTVTKLKSKELQTLTVTLPQGMLCFFSPISNPSMTYMLFNQKGTLISFNMNTLQKEDILTKENEVYLYHSYMDLNQQQKVS